MRAACCPTKTTCAAIGWFAGSAWATARCKCRMNRGETGASSPFEEPEPPATTAWKKWRLGNVAHRERVDVGQPNIVPQFDDHGIEGGKMKGGTMSMQRGCSALCVSAFRPPDAVESIATATPGGGVRAGRSRGWIHPAGNADCQRADQCPADGSVVDVSYLGAHGRTWAATSGIGSVGAIAVRSVLGRCAFGCLCSPTTTAWAIRSRRTIEQWTIEQWTIGRQPGIGRRIGLADAGCAAATQSVSAPERRAGHDGCTAGEWRGGGSGTAAGVLYVSTTRGTNRHALAGRRGNGRAG